MDTAMTDHAITSLETLLPLIGTPSPSSLYKETPFTTPLVRQFVSQSPYFMLATASADGTCDASPRGDPPGSVIFLDDTTLAFAERKGNRRVDSLRNIIENPHVGLLFLVPGVDETVRINGRATLTTDPELCERLAMNGRPPQLAVVVEIDQVYSHCARSILRSKLWEAGTWPDPDTVPTLAAMIAEQARMEPPDERAGKRNEDYRTILY